MLSRGVVLPERRFITTRTGITSRLNWAIDRVTLTFRQIAFQDLRGGTSVQDDWTVRSEVGPAESWESESYEIDASGVQRSEADAT